MSVDRFLAERRPAWLRLEAILDRISRGGPGALTREELRELGPLYRRAAADLAYARTHRPDPAALDYLNRLVARGHLAIYRPTSARAQKALLFLRRGFPAVVRQTAWASGTAAALFILGGLAGYALTRWDAGVAVIPEAMRRSFEQAARERAAGGAHALPFDPRLIASFIVTNNIQVGFVAFATGIAFGLGTALVLVQNGLLIGGLAALAGGLGIRLSFWSLILPHGVIELTAVFLCGGAGLLLAQALVAPGDFPRREVLVANGRLAVQLVIGTLPLFAVAAVIESFFTPAPAAPFIKLAFAALTAVGLIAYLGSAGREPESPGL